MEDWRLWRRFALLEGRRVSAGAEDAILHEAFLPSLGGWSGFARLLALFHTIALAVQFQDVYMISETAGLLSKGNGAVRSFQFLRFL